MLGREEGCESRTVGDDDLIRRSAEWSLGVVVSMSRGVLSRSHCNDAGRRAATKAFAALIISGVGLHSAEAQGPADLDWGNNAPTVFVNNSGAGQFITDFVNEGLLVGQPSPLGWDVDGGGAEQLTLNAMINCGGGDDDKDYDIPVYFFNDPASPGKRITLGMTSQDGSAIALNMSYFGSSGYLDKSHASWSSSLAGTVMHEAAHVHFDAELKANGEEDCYEQVQAHDGNNHSCNEAFASAYEAEQLCSEANSGSGTGSAGWSPEVKEKMKSKADAKAQDCVSYKVACDGAQELAGCTLTPPCGAPDGCPGECQLD
jgi:hypothetical protein